MNLAVIYFRDPVLKNWDLCVVRVRLWDKFGKGHGLGLRLGLRLG